MLTGKFIFIFLISANLFAQISLQDELNELKVASDSVDLSDWPMPKKETTKKYVVEDSVRLNSSGLKKPLTEETPIEAPPEQLNTIRYRSR